MPSFSDLGVPAVLVKTLDKLGIDTPTPIQAATLPDSLKGRDVLGRGRTGSGKTFAFLLPLVARLDETRYEIDAYRPRSLVLAPTRELANQIADSLKPLAAAAGLSYTTVFGGVGQNPQVKALKAGVDVLIACPGRLEDLMGQGFCDLSDVEVCILDEADHMADMGFLPGVKRILTKVPREAQHLLFSATLDGGIDVLVKKFLSNPVTHQADSAQSPVATMEHHVFAVDPDSRIDVLTDLVSAPGRTVVFTRTKHGAKKLAKQLAGRGIPAVDLHGNLSQNARVRNLDAFHSGAVETLVATDIAARGIHVDDVSLVVHADPPTEHKAYLHRSGRTARAGAAGTVITLMTPDQRGDVKSLLRMAKINATTTNVTASHPLLEKLAPGERRTMSADEVAAALPTAPVQEPSRKKAPKDGGEQRQGGRGQGGRSGGRNQGGGRSGGAATGGRDGNRAGGRPSGGSGSRSQGGSRGGSGARGSGAAGRSGGARRSGGAAGFSSNSRAGR
ncbi:DEAD/DEAH box helicase [Dermacoccus nishinomiyaensis]|uniref:DEAD/DEAH box helicase n=1 Tax=Dermacoccus nishinomiyaensis TaxID=1274 RepID=UPI0011A37C0F